MAVSALREDNASGWQASLDLQFKCDAKRSYLAARRHVGPLRVQRPFYPEDETICHVYVLHPPGGVVGGDELHINVAVEQAAHALLTTPAAGKFYRSAGSEAVQNQIFQIGQGATLEWLPQENIVFSGANAVMQTRVDLAPQANFIAWDISCLGRGQEIEAFIAGQLTTRFEIWQSGQALFVERALIDAQSEILQARWGMAGCSVMGTMVCVGDCSDIVDTIRQNVEQNTRLMAQNGFFTVTQLSGVLVCRYLGQHAEDAKACFAKALESIRPALLQKEFHRPRIWDT